MNPLDYSLCDQTVTFYRKTGDEILRKVADGCHLSCKYREDTENYGKSLEKKFQLIIPAGSFQPEPGDRVYAGIGPEAADWERFIPALVPALYEISFVTPCFWAGELVHWEAGHKKEAL